MKRRWWYRKTVERQQNNRSNLARFRHRELIIYILIFETKFSNTLERNS